MAAGVPLCLERGGGRREREREGVRRGEGGEVERERGREAHEEHGGEGENCEERKKGG